jgi:hypothetical protein
MHAFGCRLDLCQRTGFKKNPETAFGVKNMKFMLQDQAGTAEVQAIQQGIN